MKKIILILTLGLIAMFSNAQSPNQVTTFAGVTSTNMQTVYLAVTSAKPITMDYAINLTVIPTNVSGTATVACMPQGSLDGTTYFDLQASTDNVNTAGTPANKYYNYTNAYWRYYRLKLVSSGTGVTSFSGSLSIKK